MCHAAERNNDLKLLEAAEKDKGKSLIPRAADADDEDDADSSDDDSDEVFLSPLHHSDQAWHISLMLLTKLSNLSQPM